MARVLIINPNTSSTISDTLTEHARRILTEVEFHTVTARFGAQYIASETAYAIAAHAVLDAYAASNSGKVDVAQFDAILIACFGDPGLQALQEISPVPVEGLAQAAMHEAAQHGRFAIVTGGLRWAPMLNRLAVSLQLHGQLAGIQLLRESGAELAADRSAALRLLEQACRDAWQLHQPNALILGGAALAGFGEELQQRLGLPIIDSVSAGFRAVQNALTNPLRNTPAKEDVRYIGLSPALAQVLDS